MNFNFDDHEMDSRMSGSHEDLFELEEKYLERFGVYPNMPELSKETIDYYISRIRQSLELDKRMEELKK